MLTKPSKAKPVKTIKGYRLQANYGGKQYKRRFIQNENLAYQLQRKVNERIYHFLTKIAIKFSLQVTHQVQK